MIHHDLLIEIFTEELPPKRLSLLQQAFENGIRKQLVETELSFSSVRSFATPRRLAVIVSMLADQQPAQKIERKGPNVKQAYDAQGNLTPAGKGFLNSCGITIDQLSTIQTDKGECLNFIGEKPGLPVTTLIPEIVKTALKELPIPKPMRWGNNDFTFIRPVHGIILLYGEEIIPTTLFGIPSNRATQGHRQLCREEILIGFPDEYETLLEAKGFVVASTEKRKAIILDQINTLLQQHFAGNAHAQLEPDLLEEVTSLVEWPKVLLCQFDKTFLNVPQEALIASMQGHQKCFPVADQNNKLLPYFFTVSNLDSRDKEAVILGNERVMRARLSDAKFFYETDLKTRLETYTPRLSHTVYQEKLGSLADKVERVKKLAVYFAEQIGADVELTKRAAELCKLDLFSHMVGEFPELQGIMGKYYASKEQGDVANAIEEHYWPRFAEDKIPTAPVSVALALADRLDTIVGFFSVGLIPTGDKDPFALRRAALGVLKIIIENGLDVDLEQAITQTLYISKNIKPKEPVHEEFFSIISIIFNFFQDRLKMIVLEKNITLDVFNAMPGLILKSPSKIIPCARILQNEFKKHPHASIIIQSDKRIKNLLLKKSQGSGTGAVSAELFEKEIERKLFDQHLKIMPQVGNLENPSEYLENLLRLAEFAPTIDEYFKEVMVMTDNLEIRENRLQLLLNLRLLFLRVADFSELQLAA